MYKYELVFVFEDGQKVYQYNDIDDILFDLNYDLKHYLVFCREFHIYTVIVKQ